jgi:hypothetical protein
MNEQDLAEKTDYQGYSNYETWNVCLWLGGDEGLYRSALAFKNNIAYITSTGVTSTGAKIICENLFPSGRTQDEAFLLFVNWKEVANYINEMS